nr:hypothetical protein [uncultured Marinifilum sp.]
MLDSNIKLEIDVKENENYLIFEFASAQKLISLSKIKLRKQTIQKTIGFYSDLKLKWEILNEQSKVFIPKIKLEEYQ